MIVKVRTMSVAVPLAAALTAAATVSIFETPWNALPGVFGGMVTTTTGPLVALGHIVTEPVMAEARATDTSAADFDTATVIELPAPTAEQTLAAAAANDPIDYMRLNTDVRVVTDTLDRFNQKLLRMIAQAKASQSGRPIQPVAVDTEATVALDVPVASPGSETELKQ